MNPDIVFWIFSFLLFVIGLAFVLPPLMKKPTDIADDRRYQNISITKSQLAELETEYKEKRLEKETYLQAKDELEEALYQDLDQAEDSSTGAVSQQHSKLAVLFVALFVPILATAMYLKVGRPEALQESSVDRSTLSTAKNKSSANAQMSIEKMVGKLEDKLKAEPEDFKGWTMLGRSYMVLNRPADAVKAYKKALAIKPDVANVLLQMADALATSRKGNLAGEPEALILQALEKEPGNMMGLWLAGMSANQRGAKDEAIRYWKQVLPMLQSGSKEKNEVIQLITRAGGDVDEPGINQASNTDRSSDDAKKVSTSTGIIVTVDLAEELKARANPNDTVFIYAKAVTGPPMPLAAVRKQVKDLPVKLILDDTMAMMPQLKLSGYKQVTVGARVSVNGTPTKSAGDLYSEQSPISLGDSVSLTIDKILK